MSHDFFLPTLGPLNCLTRFDLLGRGQFHTSHLLGLQYPRSLEAALQAPLESALQAALENIDDIPSANGHTSVVIFYSMHHVVLEKGEVKLC